MASLTGDFVRVTYAYSPMYSGSDELSLEVGDIVQVTDRSHESSGWLVGQIGDRAGVFPATIVEPYVAGVGTKTGTVGASPAQVRIHFTADAADEVKTPEQPPDKVTFSGTVSVAESLRQQSGRTRVPTVEESKRTAALQELKSVARRSSNPNNALVTENIRRRQTLFCLYAHYSALLSSTFYMLTGYICFFWGAYGRSPVPGWENPRIWGVTDGVASVVAILSGLAILIYEIRFGEARAGVNRIPFRGIIYTLCAAPGFLTIPTGVGGLCLMIPALVNFYSTCLGESYRPPAVPPPKADSAKAVLAKQQSSSSSTSDGRAPAANSASSSSSSSTSSPPPQSSTAADSDETPKVSKCDQILTFLGGENPDRQVGRIVFLVSYFATCIIVGTLHAMDALSKVDEAIAFNEENRLNPKVPPVPDMPYHTRWIGMCKFFGNIMNLNFTFILFPVSHSVMRYLVDKSRPRTWYGMLLRAFLWLVPVDDAIKGHKLMGYVGFIAAMGHTIGHLMNYVSRPDYVWDLFGPGIWVTGVSLVVILFIMYPATILKVRRSHFEIFWVTHFLYMGVFVICLIHGKGMWGPNYWKWLLGPGLLYLGERIYREIVTRKPVTVVSATFMSNQVLSIAVRKSGPLEHYSEGQYAYIACPAISSFQWHPFTISSAPQEENVTFHIRVQDRGSWTYKLRDFFRIIGSGSNKACLKLAHLEDGEIVPGLVYGPTGLPLLRIHGPYSAPTQHFCEYNEVLVCASGIGVTPLSSALKSIVHFRWKYAVDRAFPDNATFIWVAAHREIPSFRWLIRVIKEAEDALYHQRQRAPADDDIHKRYLKIMIFVTSYNKAEADKFLRLTAEERDADETGLWGESYFAAQDNPGPNAKPLARAKAPFTEADIYAALMNPKKGTVTFGNLEITLGRPNWEAIFRSVHQRTKESNIGVTFCGNPAIGRDLKHQCLNFSHITGPNGEVRTWHLHKEVF